MISIDKNNRHKLYWIDYSESKRTAVDESLIKDKLRVLNVGCDLASVLKDIEQEQISSIAIDYLTDLMDLNKNVVDLTSIPFVIIKNFGILQEKFIGIDVEKFMKDYSKNTGLVLLWEGSVTDTNHFCWPNTDLFSLKFEDTNIQKIDIR